MENKEDNNKIGQSQLFDIITGDGIGWQEIIYDLVKTEQLDPWDIDLGILAEKYLQVIQQLEEANFFVSSKVLLACSLLLRIKSELLLNRYIQTLDEVLYGKKESKQYVYERIELDENEIPILIPKTPMARFKKVSLQELMSALNQAIETENRRIKKEINFRQAEKSALVVLPRADRVNLKERISILFAKIKAHITKTQLIKMKFSELAPSREEKLAAFVPVLHLSNQEKVYLDQEKHFDEIYMALQKMKEDLTELSEEFSEDDMQKAENFEEDEIDIAEQ